MILFSSSDSARFEKLNPRFARVFECLHSLQTEHLEPGMRLASENEDIIMMVNEETTKLPKRARLEIHRRYIDIHVPLSRRERYGWKASSDLNQPSEDSQHYADEPDTYLEAEPGQMVIFFHEDAHAACIGDGESKIVKIVMKVRV